jgi:hypothetical protein
MATPASSMSPLVSEPLRLSVSECPRVIGSLITRPDAAELIDGVGAINALHYHVHYTDCWVSSAGMLQHT